MFKVEKDQQYGDFIAVKRIDAERGIYGCKCVHCNIRKKFTRAELKKNPVCDCQDSTVSVEIDEQRSKVKTALALASKFVNVEDDGSVSSVPSLWESQSNELTTLLEQANNQESIRKFQSLTLKMLVDLVPYAERQYREYSSQSNAYALNALITQIRELTADLSAEQDKGALALNIVTNILHPAFLSMAQLLIDNMYSLKKNIENDIKPERVERANGQVDQATRDMAQGFQTLFYDVRQKVIDGLSE